MKIIMESTNKIVTLLNRAGDDGVPARIWQGKTESGIPVIVYVTRLQVQTRSPEGQCEFAAELQECAAPSTEVAAIPLRLIL